MRSRINYTGEQMALMWGCWQKDDSLAQIAKLFDCQHFSVERILPESGHSMPPADEIGLI